jgi:hypothetical protein
MKLWVILLSALALSALPVLADSEVSFSAVGGGETIVGACLPLPGCTTELSLPGFNPSWGTLTGVAIQLSLSFSVEMTYGGAPTLGYVASGTYAGELTEGLPGGGFTLEASADWSAVASLSDCFNGPYCSPNFLVQGTSSDLMSFDDLSDFISSGDLTFSAAYTDYSGGAVLEWLGSYSYGETITYSYVPEPSALLLLCTILPLIVIPLRRRLQRISA